MRTRTVTTHLLLGVSMLALTGFATAWANCHGKEGCGPKEASACGAKMSACETDKGDYEAKALKSDIVDTAKAAGSFNTLLAAAEAAGLVETLKGDGPLTVFAPTDEAFAKLPEGTVESLLKPENKEKLVAILTYHVVPGKVLAEQVVGLDSAKTVNGQSLKVALADGGVKINDAKVIQTDIMTTNGVIHVIDSVILPPEKEHTSKTASASCSSK